MDVLADALAVAGVRGTVAVRIDGSRDWGVRWAQNADAVLYAVASGSAWLTPASPEGGAEPIELLPGDVVLLPTGAAHHIAGDPHRTPKACDVALTDELRETGAAMKVGTGEPHTHLLGASYQHDRVVSLHVFTLLPPVVHIRGSEAHTALDGTVRLLTQETADPQLATSVVLDRLVDVVLVQLLRCWLRTHPDLIRGSWLGALTDPLVADAMNRMHREPDRPWSTEALAQALAVSRSTLTRRFREAAGQSPGAYLTRWRMDLAARQLRDTDTKVESIARSVGYTSVYAFNRAFSRTRSLPPARFRRDSRRVPHQGPHHGPHRDSDRAPAPAGP
ncbi:AraC family transcriptional regulator [Streptomyces iconiensis]|uniref:AraC family transcriptional regulator n=1 Tax=Streptomyces iconiensis TaxID=1384038 RepID=A0ABT7A7X5_9ACTN|nr:AraC family transcriptional regulator [Streptomyces iconiensis]MDJ1136946.1 AraC family transcriptional regulator [Streptomyces iconiensis]